MLVEEMWKLKCAMTKADDGKLIRASCTFPSPMDTSNKSVG